MGERLGLSITLHKLLTKSLQRVQICGPISTTMADFRGILGHTDVLFKCLLQ